MSFLFATSSLVGLKRCPRLLHIGQTAHTASISSRYRRIHTSSVGAGPPATTAEAGSSLQEVNAAVPEAAIQTVNQSPNLVSKLLSLSSDGFLALPHTLGIASYAVTIVLLTLLLRCSITVPVTIWQRKRVKRVQDLVVPAAKQWLASAKYSLRAEYRRAGKSYEEYVAALNARAKQQIKVLSARYRCRPLPTMLLPPLLHIPVFISTTFTIREACRRSSVSLQTSLQALQDGKAAIVGDGGVCNLALESFAWCPSLTDVDPYSLLPVMVGLTALLNVEMQARIRQALVAARELAVTQEAEANEVSNGQATGIGQEATNRGTVNVRPRPPVRPAAIRASVLQKNTLTTSTRTCLPTHSSSIKSRDSTSGSRSPTVSASSARQSGITNVLRFASIVFIPVAAISPVAVNIYWVTSNLFTLAQNLVLSHRDNARIAKTSPEQASPTQG